MGVEYCTIKEINMFYKVGFYVSLIALLICGWFFMRLDPTRNEGAQSWVGMYSTAPADTVKFMQKVFGMRATDMFANDPNTDYIMLTTRRQFWPFGGVMKLPPKFAGISHTMAYLTTLDFEATHRAMIAAGAREVMERRSVGEGGNKMRFGIYVIPGGIEIGIAQYRGVR